MKAGKKIGSNKNESLAHDNCISTDNNREITPPFYDYMN